MEGGACTFKGTHPGNLNNAENNYLQAQWQRWLIKIVMMLVRRMTNRGPSLMSVVAFSLPSPLAHQEIAEWSPQETRGQLGPAGRGSCHRPCEEKIEPPNLGGKEGGHGL